jgi:hypothetical protein
VVFLRFVASPSSSVSLASIVASSPPSAVAPSPVAPSPRSSSSGVRRIRPRGVHRSSCVESVARSRAIVAIFASIA